MLDDDDDDGGGEAEAADIVEVTVECVLLSLLVYFAAFCGGTADTPLSEEYRR